MDLIQMFKEIEHYHKALGYDFSTMPFEERLTHIRTIVVALHQELAELTDSFPWKPWRSIKSQTYNRANAIEEIVDIIFFLGKFMEAAHINPITVKDMFHYKLKENYRRIEIGYNNRPEERR